MRRAEKRSAPARPCTRGSGGVQVRPQRGAPGGEVERRAQRAPRRPAAPRGGCRRAWRARGRRRRAPRARRGRTPRARRGRATALAALTHSGTRAGSTPPSVSSSAPTRCASASGEVVALVGARGVGGEQQVGARGVEAELGARLRALDRAEALEVDAAGQHDGAPARGARRGGAAASEAETAASRSMNGSTAPVARRVRGWRGRVPWTVSARTRAGTASAGQAVSPKWACTTSKAGRPAARERGGPPWRRRSSTRGARERARAGRELVQLDLDTVQARAARRPGRGRSARARGGRRRAACWRRRARARPRP